MKKLFNFLGIILTIILVPSCEKKPVPPSLSTTTVTEISTTTAVSGGSITADGGAPIVSRGVCWNTSNDPTIENSKTTENGDLLSFTSNITQLLTSTLYYVRAYAVNSAGISYGKSVSFKTLGDKPTSNSQNASNIQLTAATLNGTVNPNSLETTVTFEYGITTSYGSTLVAQQSPLSGDSDGNVSANLTGLIIGTTYHFRIKAENSLGITYSSDITFTTLGKVPSLTVSSASNITTSSPTLNALMNPNHLPTTLIFEYGIDTNYGNILIVTQNPVTDSSDINMSVNLTGLTELTAFHYRFKAENQLGTTISNDMTFSTTGTVSDIDGNIYKAVLIGNQKWMAENLKTKHFSNGDPILNGETVADICDQNAYYFNYNMDLNNTTIYGLLYNYYAASNSHTIEALRSDLIPSGFQGACPTGWHLPSFPEYQVLIDFLGGSDVAGGKLKSLQLWNSSNLGATNSSSFNALPAGGYDKLNFNYGFLGQFTFFWSTSGDSDYLKGIYLDHSLLNVSLNVSHRCTGYSIRCLKD